MDWQIRLIILLIGLALVAYVAWDYQRKKKRQQEQDRLIEKLRAEAERVDASGFDATGVGQVRKVVLASQKSSDQALIQTEPDGDAPQQNPSESIEQNKKNHQIVTEPDLVLTLILRAEADKPYQGKDFMPLLLSQGLRHGDLGIFHRHQTVNQGVGKVMYSVANAVEPGTFELAGIEAFVTPAFAFFMTLPGPDDPVAAYEAMVRTARLLRDELGGKLLDDSKSVYTQQTHQHRLEQIQAHQVAQKASHAD